MQDNDFILHSQMREVYAFHRGVKNTWAGTRFAGGLKVGLMGLGLIVVIHFDNTSDSQGRWSQGQYS